jgi:hypothetical protein
MLLGDLLGQIFKYEGRIRTMDGAFTVGSEGCARLRRGQERCTGIAVKRRRAELGHVLVAEKAV